MKLLLALLFVVGTAACTGRDIPEAAPEPDPACDQQAQRTLDATPALALHPAGTEQLDRLTECDGGVPFAERHYGTKITPQEVITFYRTSLEASAEWKVIGVAAPATTDSALGETLICAAETVNGEPAYLELSYPGDDSERIDGQDEDAIYFLDLSPHPQNNAACGE